MIQAGKTPAGQPVPLYYRLEEKLGVSNVHSDGDLAQLVENRLPAASAKALMNSGFSDEEVYTLVIPRRTLAHRIARHQPLSSEESDRAVRLARITSLAEQVFGEPDRAWRWLRKEKRQFNSRTPLDMLQTEAGARLVEELLYQMDDGIFA